MKSIHKLILVVLIFLALSASVYAQSSREQLQQMTAQLQQTPNDNALRERIIKLGEEIKPAPAVPEEAIRYDGRAQFSFKSDKSKIDFLAAAEEYEKTVASAPWVPGYYSDLCTIYEEASKFEYAKRNCGFYLTDLSDPDQMTDVRLRIAGLEFGIEKDKSKDVAPMVLVPAGEFLYGYITQRLSLQAFFMDKYEVTTKLYAAFLQATGCTQPEDWTLQVALVESSDRPGVVEGCTGDGWAQISVGQ